MTNKEALKVLKRDDYVRLSAKMRERVEQLACKVRDKMYDLDMKSEIYCPTGTFELTVISGHTSVGYYSYLGIRLHEREWHVLDGSFDGYIHGDFNHRAVKCTNEECLEFLNAANEVFDWLDSAEDEKVESINEALEQTKEL